MEGSLLRGYLSCPVCSRLFTNPVTLGCHHSLCSGCLLRHWERHGNRPHCPVCQRRSSKDSPTVNPALKELADSFTRTRSEQEEREQAGSEVACSKHTEEPKWFCEEEQKTVCHVCECPQQHAHKVVPVKQAVRTLRVQMEGDLQALWEKWDCYRDTQAVYREVCAGSLGEVTQHCKRQAVTTERLVKAEFEKLHQFLREEEEARLITLREEEEEKGKTILKEMKMIEEKLSSLSDSISAVEQDLLKPRYSFLTSYLKTQRGIRAQCALPNPKLVSGALLDVAKHLGNLSFRVWEKMKERVRFTPVILDPNTAKSSLSLSDDLTGVTNSEEWQKVPDNPERNTKYPTVLGAEGFSSGQHDWELEVGDHPDWNAGVANQSIDRRAKRFAAPDHGIWALMQSNGQFSNGMGDPVTVTMNPRRIRVQLDYERGELSFYNSEDMSHIYTHKDIFTEKLFPYFSIGKAGGANNPGLKLCCQSDRSSRRLNEAS
ncbi:E3 ubiquitin-protein ligase TRIM35-like [Aplochiton taeniatus]